MTPAQGAELERAEVRPASSEAEVQLEELRRQNAKLEAKVARREREIRELSGRLEASFLGSVRVLAQLSEQHDAWLGSHSKRVALLALGLGKALGLSASELRTLEIAATLHDVGRGLSLKRLRQSLGARRRRPLLGVSLAEAPDDPAGAFGMDVSHAEQGAVLLSLIPGMEEVALLVRHHHARFDGQGAPEGFQGEAIPRGARILAVVDAYDLAINGRVDLAEATVRDALRKVRAEAESGCLDPTLVDRLDDYLVSTGAISAEKELELRGVDLRIGMRLSQPLTTAEGTLLLPAETVVNERHMWRLERHLVTAPLASVFVYRSSC